MRRHPKRPAYAPGPVVRVIIRPPAGQLRDVEYKLARLVVDKLSFHDDGEYIKVCVRPLYIPYPILGFQDVQAQDNLAFIYNEHPPIFRKDLDRRRGEFRGHQDVLQAGFGQRNTDGVKRAQVVFRAAPKEQNEYGGPSHVGGISPLAVCRPWGTLPFSGRDRRMLLMIGRPAFRPALTTNSQMLCLLYCPR